MWIILWWICCDLKNYDFFLTEDKIHMLPIKIFFFVNINSEEKKNFCKNRIS